MENEINNGENDIELQEYESLKKLAKEAIDSGNEGELRRIKDEMYILSGMREPTEGQGEARINKYVKEHMENVEAKRKDRIAKEKYESMHNDLNEARQSNDEKAIKNFEEEIKNMSEENPYAKDYMDKQSFEELQKRGQEAGARGDIDEVNKITEEMEQLSSSNKYASEFIEDYKRGQEEAERIKNEEIKIENNSTESKEDIRSYEISEEKINSSIEFMNRKNAEIPEDELIVNIEQKEKEEAKQQQQQEEAKIFQRISELEFDIIAKEAEVTNLEEKIKTITDEEELKIASEDLGKLKAEVSSLKEELSKYEQIVKKDKEVEREPIQAQEISKDDEIKQDEQQNMGYSSMPYEPSMEHNGQQIAGNHAKAMSEHELEKEEMNDEPETINQNMPIEMDNESKIKKIFKKIIEKVKSALGRGDRSNSMEQIQNELEYAEDEISTGNIRSQETSEFLQGLANQVESPSRVVEIDIESLINVKEVDISPKRDKLSMSLG